MEVAGLPAIVLDHQVLVSAVGTACGRIDSPNVGDDPVGDSHHRRHLVGHDVDTLVSPGASRPAIAEAVVHGVRPVDREDQLEGSGIDRRLLGRGLLLPEGGNRDSEEEASQKDDASNEPGHVADQSVGDDETLTPIM
jgi:hypothetical protein